MCLWLSQTNPAVAVAVARANMEDHLVTWLRRQKTISLGYSHSPWVFLTLCLSGWQAERRYSIQPRLVLFIVPNADGAVSTQV